MGLITGFGGRYSVLKPFLKKVLELVEISTLFSTAKGSKAE
ncbi:MAG TPA: hypothetical protein VHP36_07590 [Chitinispirillaceae bacterium]|nr:hypothetical protein [Chitinispirillaceae bacterium]